MKNMKLKGPDLSLNLKMQQVNDQSAPFFFPLPYVMVLIILLAFSDLLQVRYYIHLLVKLQLLLRRKVEGEVKREGEVKKDTAC